MRAAAWPINPRVSETVAVEIETGLGKRLRPPRLVALTRRWSPAMTTLTTTSVLHIVNDAYIAILYPLLPLIAADLKLSYGQIGLLKAAFSGVASVFQLPMGLLAERMTIGAELVLLVGGNAWMAGGLVAMALAPTYLVLIGAAVVGGIGGGPQHPLAAGLVSRAYERGRRGSAVGTLNFAGDLGKLAGPALAGILGVTYGWRAALGALAAVGLVCSLVTLAGRTQVTRSIVRLPARRAEQPRAGGSRAGWGIAQPRSFALLTAVGMVDGVGRGAGLALLPFILTTAHGLDGAAISGLYALIFAGGAAGKFFCGWLGDRIGSVRLIWVTELVTAAAMILFILLSGPVLAPLALVFGFALNGTSSVLYAATAGLIEPERRARGYGLYYTGVLAASALAPAIFGVAADLLGLTTAFALLAVVVLTVVPLSAPLRRVLA